MKTRLALAATALLALQIGEAAAVDGSDISGRSVSIHYTHGSKDWQAMEYGSDASVPRGSMCLYAIQHAAVTRCDTIYPRTQGFAQYPAFNYSATQVAFLRWGVAPSASDPKTGGPVNGGKSYISTIDITTRAVTNLVELRNYPGNENALDWPAGDWIYYVNPAPAGGFVPFATVNIRRVHALTKEDQNVCDLHDDNPAQMDCNYARRFTLDATGTYACFQIMPNTGGCTGNQMTTALNGIVHWPPTNCNIAISTFGGNMAGCNAAVSPGARLLGAYFGGAHQNLTMRRLNDAGVGTDLPELNNVGQVNAWSAVPVADGTTGAELVRWSVNSDKWVGQNFGWWGHAGALYNGSNSVWTNWIDHKTINVSQNPKVANAVVPPNDVAGGGTLQANSCTGDFWVDGGQTNVDKYEDENGAWHSVPGATGVAYVPSNIAQHHSRGSSISLDNRGGSLAGVRIVDVRGRTISVSGESGLSMHGSAQGVRIVSDARTGQARMVSALLR